MPTMLPGGFVKPSTVEYLTQPGAVCTVRLYPNAAITIADDGMDTHTETGLLQVSVWSDMTVHNGGDALLMQFDAPLSYLREGYPLNQLDALRVIGQSLMQLADEARDKIAMLAALED